MRVCVVTVSDSCSKNHLLDKSGPTLLGLLENSSTLKPVKVVESLIVPDELEEIKRVLVECSRKCDLVLTTGGTGLAQRDVTPEATKVVIERECLGIATAILVRGLQQTPMAALSRLTAGTVGQCLIVNLPGSVKAVKEGFDVLENLIPHAISLLKNDTRTIEQDHEIISEA